MLHRKLAWERQELRVGPRLALATARQGLRIESRKIALQASDRGRRQAVVTTR